MQIEEILQPERVLFRADISSKKVALETLAELVSSAAPEVSREQVFDALVARERLGSTGLGYGVAIPHGRIPQLEAACGGILRLSSGIDFDAADGQPVDLFFVLLVPEDCTDEHLKILACLAEMFADPGFLEQLRASPLPEDLYQNMVNWHPKAA